MKERKIFLKIINIISILAFVFFAYTLSVNNILPLKYRFASLLIILSIYLVLTYLIFKVLKGRVAKTITAITLILMAIFFVISSIYIQRGANVLNSISKDKDLDNVNFSLVALKDSKYKNIEDVNGDVAYADFDHDKMGIEEFKEKLKSKNIDLTLKDSSKYALIARDLLDRKVNLMLLNESFRSLIEEIIPDFSNKTVILYTDTVTLKKDSPNNSSKDKPENKRINDIKSKAKGFNFYISGIDTFGPLSKNSRSDVNIILSINPDSKKIQITTIPRDSYVRIQGGGNNEYDKLTHAGIYGINSSVDTLEKLFDLPINYYARVNFSSLIKLIDAIGGINVDNPRAFSMNGRSFEAGNIHLDGAQALAFSRERKSLADGDLDRGRNQMRVIEGIIRKAISPSILFKYNDILSVVLNYMETNIPYDKVSSLANNEISNPGKWTIDKRTVEGYGSMDLPSYAMPGWKLYMYKLNKKSVESISNEMYEIIK